MKTTLETINLGELQQTLLLSFWARAMEACHSEPILYDPKALEILPQINYDFKQLTAEQSSQLVVCLRGLVFDRWVKRVLQDHPRATVVEIGAGLSTRFERVDNGTLQWFDLDLPDAIAIRQRYFPERDRVQLIPGSVLETDWIESIKIRSTEPLLLIAEGVLVYFQEAEVKTILTQLADHFPGSLLMFDATSPFMIKYRRRFDAIKYTQAQFQWGIKNIKEIEAWDARLQVVESVYLSDFPQYFRRFSWFNRLLITLIPKLLQMYGMHLVKLGDSVLDHRRL